MEAHRCSPRRRATVLVVDDEESVRSVTARALRRYGYEVLEAADGEEALRTVRGRAGALDLLLTDVVMPGMDGGELAERIAAEHPSLPVLFMSGFTSDEAVLRRVRAAEVGFLAKPFEIASLACAVAWLLE